MTEQLGRDFPWLARTGEDPDVSDHKNPIDQALDVFVFAPLGLLFSARETIPQLAEKGRQYVAAARVMGEFALGQGREQAEKVVRQASDQAGQTLSIVGGLTARRPSTPPRRSTFFTGRRSNCATRWIALSSRAESPAAAQRS